MVSGFKFAGLRMPLGPRNADADDEWGLGFRV